MFCITLPAAKQSNPMLKHIAATHIPKSLIFFRSSSSSPSPRSKYHNYYLRKRRKWPHPVYKSRWHQKLSQQHAMQLLRHQTPSTNPLSSLTYSFSLYNCTPTPNAYHFLIKTLIQYSQSYHIPSLLHHLQYHEQFETPESIFIDLIDFYAAKNQFQQAVDLFFRIPSFRCVATVDSLNCLISALCSRKEGLEIVPQVLVKSRLINVRLDGSSFTILIKALCRFNKPVNAVALLRHMVDHGIDVDEKCFSLILLTLCQQNDLECDKVMCLVEEMKKLGFRLERTDWENVIRFLVRRKMGMEALEALNKMKFDGFTPDVICYTMALDVVISVGDYEHADQVFDEVLVTGLVPDINTYNVYVNGLCKQNKFDEGIKMVASMEELGCKPNIVTYNILLCGIYDRGEFGLACDFLKHVRGKGGVWNSETYETMIRRMVNEGDVMEALGLLKEMVHKRLVPKPLTLDEIVSSLCRNGLVSNGLNLLTEMLGKNVFPGCRSWEALIVGFQIEQGFKEIDFEW